MKHYHPIGEPFNLTLTNGKMLRLVAREAETFVDKQFNQEFRKTCKGCVFCNTKTKYCSGHPYWEDTCTAGGCKSAKCTPEYRLDGMHIHYKWIDPDKHPNK